MTLSPGVYPAAVTPFSEDGKLDYPGLARLLAHFKSVGCTGVLMAGTTGEGPSLSAVERRDFLREAVRQSGGLPIIGATASSSFEEVVWLCRQAGDAGAVAMLVMPPSFFREASEAGIVAWFRAVMDRSPLPIMLYNFPKRTGVTLTASIVGQLSEHPMMLGLKDSSGEVSNLMALSEVAPGKALFVGDETLLLDAMAAGWSGTFSGGANSMGKWLVQVFAEWEGNRESAETKFALILPTLKVLRSAPQPGTHKRILHTQGILPTPTLRLPLLPPEPIAIEWPAFV